LVATMLEGLEAVGRACAASTTPESDQLGAC
jgi:hypothetical protein